MRTMLVRAWFREAISAPRLKSTLSRPSPPCSRSSVGPEAHDLLRQTQPTQAQAHAVEARQGLASFRRRVEEPHHVRRLCLEALCTLRKRYPWLLATGPEMHRRTQPRGVVEGATSHVANCRAGPWGGANPRPTFRTHPSGRHAPAVSGALDHARLPRNKAKCVSRKHDRHRERAAGYALAVRAMAGVDHVWR